MLGFVILTFGMSQILDAAIASSKLPAYKSKFKTTAALLKESNTMGLIGTSQNAINGLFEGIYGEKHISSRCLAFSSVSSILAISIVCIFLPEIALQSLKMGIPTLVGLILFNLMVDYISLIETRYVLSRNMKRKRDAVWYAFFDIFISAFIFSFTYIIGMMILSIGFSEAYNIDDITLIFEEGADVVWIILFLSTFFTSLMFYVFLMSSVLIRIFKTPAIKFISLIAQSDNPFKVIATTLGVVSLILTWLGTSIAQ